jgi:hypothetical protein
MVEKLQKRLIEFPGQSNRARCFTHILNLVVKSILHQFDVASTKPKSNVVDERAEELKRLAGDIDTEALEEEAGEDYLEEPDEIDNDDGWVDERDEMTGEDVDELEDAVQPVRFLLTKVS